MSAPTGICVWLTGLSGAGKSTLATRLVGRLVAQGRTVTLLDGDVVRTHLSKGLGFSRTDRDINIRRIGFVAAEVVRHAGIVVCATVSPYETTRNEVREMVGPAQFVLVHVATPLSICEQRDPKGLYAKARRGELVGFTGIDDPYEVPETPDLVLTTMDCNPDESTRRIATLVFDTHRRQLTNWTRLRSAEVELAAEVQPMPATTPVHRLVTESALTLCRIRPEGLLTTYLLEKVTCQTCQARQALLPHVPLTDTQCGLSHLDRALLDLGAPIVPR